jgi:hypothetical protein
LISALLMATSMPLRCAGQWGGRHTTIFRQSIHKHLSQNWLSIQEFRPILWFIHQELPGHGCLVEDSYGSAPLPQSYHDYKAIYDADKLTARYIDAKAGLKYCRVLKMNAHSVRYKFWWSKIETHKLEMRFYTLSKNPPNCSVDNCASCTIIGGLGGGTLKQLVKYFNETTSQKQAQRVSVKSTWCDLGVKLYHWTMADKPAFS